VQLVLDPAPIDTVPRSVGMGVNLLGKILEHLVVLVQPVAVRSEAVGVLVDDVLGRVDLRVHVADGVLQAIDARQGCELVLGRRSDGSCVVLGAGTPGRNTGVDEGRGDVGEGWEHVGIHGSLVWAVNQDAVRIYREQELFRESEFCGQNPGEKRCTQAQTVSNLYGPAKKELPRHTQFRTQQCEAVCFE
jgi:hypothetical protein